MTPRYIKCKVPTEELHDPSYCGKFERGGGKNQIILAFAPESVDPNTQEKTPTVVVQGLRVIKENPINCLKYLLPVPYLCMMYPFYYNGGGGGCCEHMDGLEWTEAVEESAIGSMPRVDAVLWDRQLCQGGSDPASGFQN